MPFGTVKRADARGFFFLSDDQYPAAQHVFAHVSETPAKALPSIGDAFCYEVERGRDGRLRAVRLQPLTAAKEECDRVFGS